MMSSNTFSMTGFVLYFLLCLHFIPCVYGNSCECAIEHSCTGCAPCVEYKPFCPLSDKGRKEFIPCNLGNCNSWSLGYNIEITNRLTGAVNVTLWLPQNLKEKGRYEVILLIHNTQGGVERSSSKPQNHSVKYFKVARSNLTCNAAVSFEFEYLYNGNYELQITQKSRSASVSSVCKSHPFSIESSYRKKLLNDLTPTTYHRYVPQRKELIFNANFGNFFTGVGPFATVVVLKSKVDMSLRDCSGSGNDVANYILNDSGSEQMCCRYEKNYTEMLFCPCKWTRSTGMLECSFQNVPNGDYCFVFEFLDPRCKPWTLWTENSVLCRWSFNASAHGNQTINVYSLQSRPSSNSPVILTVIVIAVFFVCAAIIFLICKPKFINKLRCDLNNYAANSMSRSSESSNVSWLIKDYYEKINFPEVLLLYPRDCFEFMTVMEEFRNLLKSNNCKVHDPWDDDIYSNVVESHDLWSLSYINNDNVKIIIVLSECSKKFETALLKNSLLQYREPETLDTIFMQSLSAVHQYFSNRFDSYQRIFVIQLDDDSPAMNFEFITPATVYSIPQSTKFLVQDLLSGNFGDLPNPRVTKLKEATVKYKIFRKNHPEYLRGMLM